jgi:polysaccharide export outer membrane protein
MSRVAFVLVLLVALGAGCASYSPSPHEATPRAFDLRLGPGDRVLVSVWKEDLSLETEVGPDGSISFPLVGRVDLAGLSIDEARVHMAKLLSAHLKSPVVSIVLRETKSHVVHVAGEVARPGSVPFVRGATAVGAIEAAGGFLPATACLDDVRVVRDRIGQPRVYRVDLDRVFRAEETDVYLEPGDVVYVPPRGITSWDRFWRQLFWNDPSERAPR